ncbi:MAG TPA: bifunctional hydroxymethylpyrimidine kinase/phosphomethylpyrimidine kinase [Dehalococcoidia bacterium]|nr:bifunctional hydroxymethylpyrimidine kinase/phosphomethylpyrimidine kinase [Dehalococcoidia bacterium]
MKTVMTIAGSDSSAGAGIQADLKTFAALGVYGTSVVTAITAQNTQGVRLVEALSPETVAAQIDAVVSDIGADVVKTGMLGNAAIVDVVASKLLEYGLTQLVLDPVLAASDGSDLLADGGMALLREKLLPLALVVTPNVDEAGALVGRRLAGWEDIRQAAREIVDMGARNAVIKGGDATGPAIDLFYDGEQYHEFAAARVDTENTHGTGCTFAAAIAASLAKGSAPKQAVAMAKAYVTKAMQMSYPLGHGHGPVHHFFRYWQDTTA